MRSRPAPVHDRLQEAHLLPQPHQVPPQARRLGSRRRAQPAEPRQEQVRAHLLGRGDRHHRQGDHAHPQGVRPLGDPRPGRRPRREQDHPHAARPQRPPARRDGRLHPAGPQAGQLGGLVLGLQARLGPGLPGHDGARSQRPARTSSRTATWSSSGAATTRPPRGASPGRTPPTSRYFWTGAGIKQVYICPDLNFGAAVHADKWIPILPNTDAALQLAIIYVWLKEDTWDKEYVGHPRRRHGQGRRLRPRRGRRRPQDARSGPPRSAAIPEWTIKALAREFGKKSTSIIHYFGGSDGPRPVLARARPPRVHPARHAGPRRPRRAPVADDVLRHASRRGPRERPLLQPVPARRPAQPVRSSVDAWGPQNIPKTLIQEAILNSETIHFSGTGAPERRDRGPVHRLPVPESAGRGRHPHPHDLDRHALPHHLLEPRQLDHRGAPRRQHRVHASPSTRGWRTTASTPTSSCRPTPPWRSRTSSPTSGRARPSRPACCRRRPSSRSASPRATTRSCSPSPTSWA